MYSLASVYPSTQIHLPSGLWESAVSMRQIMFQLCSHCEAVSQPSLTPLRIKVSHSDGHQARVDVFLSRRKQVTRIASSVKAVLSCTFTICLSYNVSEGTQSKSKWPLTSISLPFCKESPTVSALVAADAFFNRCHPARRLPCESI